MSCCVSVATRPFFFPPKSKKKRFVRVGVEEEEEEEKYWLIDESIFARRKVRSGGPGGRGVRGTGPAHKPATSRRHPPAGA